MKEPEENDILIFEMEYHVWREGEYLGEVTYVDDENIGPAFLSMSVDEEGQLNNEVYVADKWKLKDDN